MIRMWPDVQSILAWLRNFAFLNMRAYCTLANSEHVDGLGTAYFMQLDCKNLAWANIFKLSLKIETFLKKKNVSLSLRMLTFLRMGKR